MSFIQLTGFLFQSTPKIQENSSPKDVEIAQNFPIYDLPVEMMEQILYQLVDVCGNKEILFPSLRAALEVYLSKKEGGDLGNAEQILTNAKIYALNLGKICLRDLCLTDFPGFEKFLSDQGGKIQRINLAALPVPFDDDHIERIASLAPKLRHLTLRNWLVELPRPSEVSNISFWQTTAAVVKQGQITDNIFTYIKKLPLDVLDISECPGLTESGIGELSGSEISELNLEILNSFTGKIFATMRLDALTKLNLSTTEITDENLSHLKNFPRLETLILKKCVHITDAGIEAVSRLSLKNLYLDGCEKITDHALEILSSCLSMRKLTLDGCKMTDAALVHFQKMKLEFLSLNRCYQITATGANLLDGTTLKEVRLFDCVQIRKDELVLKRLYCTGQGYGLKLLTR